MSELWNDDNVDTRCSKVCNKESSGIQHNDVCKYYRLRVGV